MAIPCLGNPRMGDFLFLRNEENTSVFVDILLGENIYDF